MARRSWAPDDPAGMALALQREPRAGDGGGMSFGGAAAAHVRAYFEYRSIVGDADGGELLSEEEYAAFRARALEARKNRLYVSWRNSDTVDCKLIGPSSRCFCGHRYKDHATDETETKNVHCRAPGCSCNLFAYIPVHGSGDLKCHCKHSFEQHRNNGRKRCNLASRCGCDGFTSSFRCSCGQLFADHQTVFETREERMALGRPVDNLGGGGAGYAALGGLTGFSSLVDGADRLDPSGAAAIVDGRDLYREGLGAPPPRRGKLSESEEMDLYAKAFEKKYPTSSTSSRRRSRPPPRRLPAPSSSSPAPLPPAAAPRRRSRERPRSRDEEPGKFDDALDDAYASSTRRRDRPGSGRSSRGALSLLKRKHSSSAAPSSSSKWREEEDDRMRSSLRRRGSSGSRRGSGSSVEDGESSFEERIAEIEDALDALRVDGRMSRAKKYAEKKKLQMERAALLREQRRRKSVASDMGLC
eukprot:PLAT8233.1.p1 GENE.PLAT8233.1~~PLAT8233.1.p1  ORF type:complete len:471 (+),score=103.19 PLAT8233.1:37-1449(+)